MKYIAFVLITYIFGALPCGVWLGKIVKKIDIRNYGSKNSGATNAYRILGAKCGIIVLLLDILKGYIPLYLANQFGINGNYLVFLGLIAIFGHTFSIFLQFKGGKGVATSLGVFTYLMPQIIGILLIVFIIIVAITRYISLGSIVCAGLLPILAYYLPIKESSSRLSLVIVSTIIGIFVIYKHKSNIQRLMDGEENRFKFK